MSNTRVNASTSSCTKLLLVLVSSKEDGFRSLRGLGEWPLLRDGPYAMVENDSFPTEAEAVVVVVVVERTDLGKRPRREMKALGREFGRRTIDLVAMVVS